MSKNISAVRLSKQQIIDCTHGGDYQNFGCGGGSVRSSMQYAKDIGLNTEQDYPYSGKDELLCRLKNRPKKSKIEGYRSIGFENIEHIMDTIMNKYL